MARNDKKEKKEAYSISKPIEINKKEKKINLESESTKFIVILLGIVAFIAVLWIVNSLKSNNDDSKEPETININYNMVIVGNMLDQKYDKYYVYAYIKDEKDNATIEYLLTKLEHSYKLNLDRANNLPALAEESNFSGEIDKIKFKGTTLLLIEKGKIVKYYEGSDAILTYLRSLNS